ncbi:MAG TPA: hypothetical protein VNU71_14695 [Burkholderiaceae bacterium]|nr:hypothetical protein [Burkholderiaceae bacterium]
MSPEAEKKLHVHVLLIGLADQLVDQAQRIETAVMKEQVDRDLAQIAHDIALTHEHLQAMIAVRVGMKA